MRPPLWIVFAALLCALFPLNPAHAQIPSIGINREAFPGDLLFVWPYPSDEIVIQTRDQLESGSWAFISYDDYLTNGFLWGVLDDPGKDRQFFRLVNYFDELPLTDPAIQTRPSGLLYKELVAGTGTKPGPSSNVRVN